MENENLKKMEEDLINKLSIVKDDYKKCKEELVFSIRRDIVSAELKDMLIDNSDFYSLRSAIEDYANNLLKIGGD